MSNPLKSRRLRILILAGILAIVLAINVRQRFGGSMGKGISIEGGRAISVRVETLPQLQTDERWRNDELGESGEHMGFIGCTVCATSMALSSQGFRINAGDLNKKLTESGGYTSSGLLIWAAIEDLTNDEFSVKIVNRPTHAYLDKQLEKGNPLIAKVLYGGSVFHWVLISGKEGRGYLIHDPLGSGVAHDAMSEYPDGIFAVRHLIRN
ncbi:MAG: hypothetical protein AAF585_19590 [Verrucomicrobiota bacterium]